MFDEDEFRQHLDLYKSRIMEILAQHLKEQAQKNKGYPFEDYYAALAAQATVLYLALHGLNEM